MSTETIAPTLPPEIRNDYAISDDAAIYGLTGGLVNETMLVVNRGERTILQRLSPVLSVGAIGDMEAVSAHLSAHGWETPRLIPTVDDQPYATDNTQTLWRQTKFINSDGHPPITVSPDLSGEVGHLLGAWHVSMASFDRTPSHQIPYFHDAGHHAKKMESYLDSLPDGASKQLGETILAAYQENIEEILDDGQQFIHGDPKLNNWLFRCGDPFTLIDYDTVMPHSPWTDVGDFIRSVAGQGPVDGLAPHVAQFMEGYRRSTGIEVPTDQAYQATGRVALVLAMRYLCDVVDGSYFSWDSERHQSRRDNHVARAKIQLGVARQALANC